MNSGKLLPLGLSVVALVISSDFPQVWALGNPCNPSPCGKGAVCSEGSQWATCACPPGTSGDPFELCEADGKTGNTTESSSPTTSLQQSTLPSASSTTTTTTTTPNTPIMITSTSAASPNARPTQPTSYSLPTSAATTSRATTMTTTDSPLRAARPSVSTETTSQLPTLQTAVTSDRPTTPDLASRNRNGEQLGNTSPDGALDTLPTGATSGNERLSNTYEMESRASLDQWLGVYDSRPYSYTPNRHSDYTTQRTDLNSNRYSSHDSTRVIFEPNNRKNTFESGPIRPITYDSNRRDEYGQDHGASNRPKIYYSDDSFDNFYYSSNSGGNNNRGNSGGSQLGPLRRTGNDNNRNPISFPPANSGSYNRDSEFQGSQVQDPFGRYRNCIRVRGVVVCADESDSDVTRSGIRPISSQRPISDPDVTRSGIRPISSQRPISNSAPIFRDDNQNFRISSGSSHNSHHSSTAGRLKFSDRLGQAPDSSSDSSQFPKLAHTTGHGHREGTIYQEIVVRSDPDPIPASSAHRTNNGNKNKLSPQPGDPDQCKTFCGVNAICRSLLGRPICGCPEGFTGDASVRCVPEVEQQRMKNRCHKHTDCSQQEICEDSQCTNPCDTERPGKGKERDFGSSQQVNQFGTESRRIDGDSRRGGMCAKNTKCEVIGHTPLCGCLNGYTGNPYTTGCVPVDSGARMGSDRG